MGSPSYKPLLLNVRPRIQSYLANRRSAWLLLCGILFSWNTTLLWLAHTPDKYQCINLLSWLGILIVLEDQLSSLWPRPSQNSALIGSIILASVVVRGSVIQDPYDLFYLIVSPLLVLGLALLNRPISELRLSCKPLLIGLLLPMSTLLGMLITLSFAPILAKLSAFFSWLLLYGFGFRATLVGQKVSVGFAGVEVGPGCVGIDQIVFSSSILFLFLIVFPLRNKRTALAVLLLSVIISFFGNVARLSLLAYFTSLKGQLGVVLFDFFHASHGSLIFSLISASFVGYLYLLALDRELGAP
jgi:exosortase/archaeosortase family protein